MGYLLIDHRNGQNPDGSRGTLCEWDTTSCPHCQAVILVDTSGGVRKYDTPYRCFRCGNRPICRHCGEVNKGVCTPFPAVVDEAIKRQRGLEWFEYQYRSCTRA